MDEIECKGYKNTLQIQNLIKKTEIDDINMSKSKT